MKFYGGIWGGEKNKWLDFGSDPDHKSDSGIFLKDFLPLWDRDKLTHSSLTLTYL